MYELKTHSIHLLFSNVLSTIICVACSTEKQKTKC